MGKFFTILHGFSPLRLKKIRSFQTRCSAVLETQGQEMHAGIHFVSFILRNINIVLEHIKYIKDRVPKCQYNDVKAKGFAKKKTCFCIERQSRATVCMDCTAWSAGGSCDGNREGEIRCDFLKRKTEVLFFGKTARP